MTRPCLACYIQASTKVSAKPSRVGIRCATNPGGKAASGRLIANATLGANGHQTELAYLWRMENSPDTRVLYNANCPVCNFEIGHYARYAGQSGLPIRFDDLNTDARTQWGLDADTAARRLYVLHDGVLSSGIPAFLVLWAQMPRYRFLGRVMGLPVIRHLAILAYDHALAPVIYRWHLRRVRRRPGLGRGAT